MRFLSLLITLFLIPACTSLPAPVAEDADAAQTSRFRAVEDALDRGDPAVVELLTEFLKTWPDSVDGRRLDQKLRIARGEGWRVYEEAAAAFRESPADAGLTYLSARTIPDRELQTELFRRTIELDPSLFHGWYGLAVASLEAGEIRAALIAARGALVARPDDSGAMILLAHALERTGEREDAEKIYGLVLGKPGVRTAPLLAAARRAEMIGRSAQALPPVLDALTATPGVPALEGMAWSLLGGKSIPDAEVRRALGLAIMGRSGASMLLRARCRSLLGEADAALAALDAVALTEVRGFIDHDEWFGLAIAAGNYRRAHAILTTSRPALLSTSPVNSRAPFDDQLDAALLAADGSPRSAPVMAELSRALSRCGFGDAASTCASRALSLCPEDSDLQSLLAEATAWQAFLRDIKLTLRRLREAEFRGAGAVALDDVRADLARMSVRHLGRDIVTGIGEQSYPFVGRVVRTDAEGSPPEWRSRGTLLVVGQRAGAPVAAVMARLVGHLEGLLDGEVEYDLAIGRGSTVSLDDAVLGAIAGFTLPGWITIDLDVIDRTAARIRRDALRGRDEDLWPAEDETTRRSLWFPGGVRERLAVRIGEPGDAVLLATLAHERGHAVDADKYLPFLPNLPRAFVEFARHGFSPKSVEVGLERTAEIWALQFSRDTRVALANTLLFLPHERSAPPHSVAYYGIVRDLVREIDAHPGDYPSIDRRFNILQQFDRLTDVEFDRAISRALR